MSAMVTPARYVRVACLRRHIDLLRVNSALCWL